VVVAVKALACELPAARGLPLSRFSLSELKREAEREGLVGSIGATTLWRWLSQDAIRPWRYRSWIFPRDPNFAEKAAAVLDLYQGVWNGRALGPDEYVISSDEKTSLQARRRCHPSTPPRPKEPARVEHEYQRRGALAYLAAWDVRRAKIFGRCELATGVQPFHRLVDQVMQQPPYCSASRVFWIVDNGSSHRGERASRRLHEWSSNATMIHTPCHASWLNQVEIYFSVLERKVLRPNDHANLTELEDRLLGFQEHYEQIAQPFQWKFTRQDLDNLLAKLETPINRLAA
jgi:hypothetical protein